MVGKALGKARDTISTKVEHRRVGRAVTRALSAREDGRVWTGLSPQSLLLDAMAFDRARSARVNLVLPNLSRDSVFAGLRTAIAVGAQAADKRGQDLRVVVLRAVDRDGRAPVREVAAEFGLPADRVSVVDLTQIAGAKTSPDDMWVVTYWTTAHCLDLFGRRGIVDPDRVVYLVQDYEPVFYPASTEATLASLTYHAGFRLLVNSSPLARFLAAREGLEVDSSCVFCPELDWARLADVADNRRDPGPGVLFYHRPAHGRNMNSLGMVALRRAAALFRDETGDPLPVTAVGDDSDLDLGTDDAAVTNLGRLAWADYFDQLGRSRVLFGLQATPHPSHPPLDMVMAGGRSVTNELEGSRGGLHDRLVASPPDPEAMARAIVDAIVQPEANDTDDVAAFRARLGVGLPDAIGHVLG